MSTVRRERSGGEAGQKWASIAIGAAAIAAAAWLTVEAPATRRSKDPDAGTGTSVATPPPAAGTAEHADAGAPAVEDLDAGLVLMAPSLGDAAALVPSTGGPRTVKIGVVLVTFQGAEGAPPSARNKREALAIAERLGQDAKNDFHHAVTTGDPGSSDDIGRLPRGVLDAHTETAVWALSAGEISDVLETPKGYWIVKRIE